MRSFPLNGTPISKHFRNFTGGVVRVRNGRVEIFADDGPAERMTQPAKPKVPSVKAARSEVAVPGPDKSHVAALLSHAQRDGAAILTSIANQAIRRLLRGDPMKAVGATHLFTPNEQAAIAEAIASTNATANLLGRARVRLRQQRAEEAREQWDEREPTRFSEAFGPSKFADNPGTPAPIKPLAPLRAIAWFKRRVPTVRVNVGQFTQEQRDRAFWLARQTDQTVLEKVKEIILEVLATGKGTSEAPHLIQTVLDKTGVAPKNDFYAHNVFRTNMMSALNAGAQEEREDPDVQNMFPVWRYDGIDDGREGADHRPHFGQYYPVSVPFEKIRNMYVVRGGRVVLDPTGKGRPYLCRCTSTDISRYKWAALKKQGARIADGFEDPTEVTEVLQQFAEEPPASQEDLIACGVSPTLAESLGIGEGTVTRDAFHYREASDTAVRCAHCVHYQPDIPDRLGTCSLFECLPQRDRRFNLLPDVGAHMLCRAFEPARADHVESQERDAEWLRDQAREFWAQREHETAARFAEKTTAEQLAPALNKLADVIDRRQQPQSPPVVNVSAPVINVPAPVVNVAAPEVRVSPPDVHVASPIVNVQPPKVAVKVEAPPPAEVHAHVAVPSSPPPKIPRPKVVVKVNPELKIPPRQTTKDVTYDSEGNVKRVVETEREAQ